MRGKQASKEIRPKLYQLLLLISPHNLELTSTPKTPTAQSDLNKLSTSDFSGYCHINSAEHKQQTDSVFNQLKKSEHHFSSSNDVSLESFQTPRQSREKMSEPAVLSAS